VNGRKRRIAVDALGLTVAVVVRAANIQDRDGANLALAQLVVCPSLIWADGGYAGALVERVRELAGRALEIVRRPDSAKGFVVPKRRGVVERTFAWLNDRVRSFRAAQEDLEGLRGVDGDERGDDLHCDDCVHGGEARATAEGSGGFGGAHEERMPGRQRPRGPRPAVTSSSRMHRQDVETRSREVEAQERGASSSGICASCTYRPPHSLHFVHALRGL
jgi:transposase